MKFTLRADFDFEADDLQDVFTILAEHFAAMRDDPARISVKIMDIPGFGGKGEFNIRPKGHPAWDMKRIIT